MTLHGVAADPRRMAAGQMRWHPKPLPFHIHGSGIDLFHLEAGLLHVLDPLGAAAAIGILIDGHLRQLCRKGAL